tara:strand:+ start:492 stop:920 length:429 start_codon:yes stop_codon:yes gene_type:complete
MEENSNWFKLKVKYLVQTEDSIKKKTSEYVLKAVSFTDAEASLLQQLKDEFEYNLVSCSKFNIQDVRKDDAKEDYFKVKIVYVSTSEDGKESKVIDNYLIQGDTVEDITKSIKQLLSGSLMDYTVENIQRTKIQEVFYNVDE